MRVMTPHKEISKLEVDVLLVFYNFSDQYGVVDIKSAQKWAKQQLGVVIPDQPFTLEQYHYDMLMEVGALPDTRTFLAVCSKKPRRKSTKSNSKTNKE